MLSAQKVITLGLGSAVGFEPVPQYGNTLARCGHFSTLPIMSAGAGTLGDKRPYFSFQRRELHASRGRRREAWT